MSNDLSSHCPRCGASLSLGSVEGLCAKCLGALNFATETVLPGAAHRDQAMPLAVEELAPHFPQLEIIDCLGRGGMGVVYKARQKSLNRLVALKLLAPERADDPQFAERFVREAQALAALNHPNIVAVHDFGQAGGFYYLLMEFVDGVNLRQLLQAKRLTPREALGIVPPVCDALQCAHDHGIVHRDIKPENLLIDKSGVVKIADFGIAKMIGREAVQGRVEPGSEARSTVFGTPDYAAPEQHDATAATDHRADIYSLGVVLYEMLTGERPTNRMEPPSRKVQLDVRLDEIVLRALERMPELRYQTAADLRTQIEVLARTSGLALPRIQPDSWEYKSARTLWGLPLLHVTSGSDPLTGRWRVARGVFAFGGDAQGVFAFGGRAAGVVAFGGFTVGIISIGGCALGLFSLGGLALALLFGLGGLAVAPVAWGGGAAGWYAYGGMAAGVHAQGGMVMAPHVMQGVQDMPFMLEALVRAMPWLAVGYPLLMVLFTLVSFVVPAWARRKALAPASATPPAVPPGTTRKKWGPWAWLMFGIVVVALLGILSLIGVAVWSTTEAIRRPAERRAAEGKKAGETSAAPSRLEPVSGAH